MKESAMNDSLQKSEAINRSIIDFSPMGMHFYELMPDGRLIFAGANPAADKILGVDNTLFIGKTIENAFPPLALTEIPARYREVAKTGITWQTEQIDYDDHKIRGAFHVVAFKTAGNSMTAMFLDITERKRTEIELAERNKFIESVINMTPDSLYIYDIVEKKNIYSNDGIHRILGYSVEEIQSMGNQLIPLLMHPDDFQEYLQMTIPKYSRAADRELITHHYRMKRKTGEWRWLFSSESIYKRTPDGSPRQIFGMIHDITELKLKEFELVESASRFRSVFEQSPVGSVFVGLDKCFIRCNQAFCTFIGYSEQELVGKPISDITHSEDILVGMKELQQIAEGSLESCSLQKRYLRKNGDIVWGELSLSLVRDADKKPLYFLPIIKDITDRKNAEEERHKYMQQLQQTQKLESLGLLAGGIAHDFNNLMGGILGYIDLASGCSKDPDVTDYLQKALSAMNRARSLTQQLLTFAKGGSPIKKVGSLFPCVKDAAEFALSGSNVLCKFDIAENVPQCDYDRNQIGQVIENIVINAQHAMPDGGSLEIVARNVTLREKEHPKLAPGTYAKISISDHGIGIPAPLLTRIFDPFFTTKSKGHGLGLATSYSIIHRHGGAIDVESEPGKGSTFHLSLPAATAPATTEAPLSKINHYGSGTIIIMDDEEVMRGTIFSMLKTLGYTAICTKDGREALELFIAETTARRPVAGLILDLTIPGGMGGKETVSEIRKLDRMLPVFVASGYADDPVMQNPSEYGFTASISKPFMKSELAEMLSKHMYAVHDVATAAK